LSDRFLYRRIPANERLCSYHRCREPILRNIARDKDGRIYHWGCLQSARDEQYRCLECYSTFNATEAIFEEEQSSYNDEFRQVFKVICPHCGTFIIHSPTQTNQKIQETSP